MRKISLVWLGVLFVTVLLGVARSSDAATISVKQLGGGDYTKINDAIFYSQPNDIINVYPGRYEEAVVVNKNLTLIGSGPQYTTIYSTSNGIILNDNFSVTIIGFTITAAQSGIYLGTNTQSVIRNNIIASNAIDGIYTKYNVKSNIINNTIYQNALNGIGCHDGSGTSPITISNNIISNNGRYGIDTYAATESNSYNNIFGNTTGNYSSSSAGTGDISQSPSFVDAPVGNFALLSTSTSKNAGRPGSADADPDGSRNDMGAYGGPDAAAFWPYPQGTPIITNLTATPTAVQKGGTITIKATGAVQ